MRLAVRLVPLALVVAVIAVAATALTSGGSDEHRVGMVVAQATALRPGFDVRLDGRTVGRIAAVELRPDYKVRVVVGLEDEAWPLPRDSRFIARLGGTIKFGDRYLQVQRGTSPVAMTEGATLPARSYVDPVEFDTVFNVFDADTRADLRKTLANGAVALRGVPRHLPAAVSHGPAAAVSVESITGQLGGDPVALDRLVRSAAGVVDAAATADPGLGDLITNADATFTAVAREEAQLRTALRQLPPTLATARRIAARADTTLRLAHTLTQRLGPGVAELRRVAGPLATLLVTARRVAPVATATLATLRRSTPQLDGLLDRVRTPLAAQVQDIGREGAKQLDCIRPYSPEIAGLAVGWGGFFGVGDRASKVARAEAGVVPYSNETPLNSGQLAKVMGSSFGMAFPRPPGQLAGQPYYQPQCGITEDALDPEKDPESLAVDPSSKPLVGFDPPGGRR